MHKVLLKEADSLQNESMVCIMLSKKLIVFRVGQSYVQCSAEEADSLHNESRLCTMFYTEADSL
jgi:hypothetical protein